MDNSSGSDDFHGCNMLAHEHPTKLKCGHINANSIAGFKFYEINQWLINRNFDVLVITETKLDSTFADALFHIDGFRFIHHDRNINGGGVMIYWSSDLIFKHVNEALMLKLKVGRSWLMVAGVYKPLSLKFCKWKEELFKLFEHATSACEDILVLGDLNCDILRPLDNGGEGRHLLDMCDIFSLDCLINEPTRLTTTSQTVTDVLLTNNKRRFLTSGTLEPHISDHRLIYTVIRNP